MVCCNITRVTRGRRPSEISMLILLSDILQLSNGSSVVVLFCHDVYSVSSTCGIFSQYFHDIFTILPLRIAYHDTIDMAAM